MVEDNRLRILCGSKLIFFTRIEGGNVRFVKTIDLWVKRGIFICRCVLPPWEML